MRRPVLGFQTLVQYAIGWACPFPNLFRQPTGLKYDWCHLPRRLTYAKELRIINVATNEVGPLFS